ncbi:hypothetical protein ACO22_02315 [Paracoccidioides brasiliensis]|uniref:Uncharacterized protein n=1 Tax=Paracoccidioides brasiliensis TaxID=121759 RepID=A0A1D2JJ38_PARBR|nr:hypothetical protein ACO22_02315 [Paracoccidioides brasiliensis]
MVDGHAGQREVIHLRPGGPWGAVTSEISTEPLVMRAPEEAVRSEWALDRQ